MGEGRPYQEFWSCDSIRTDSDCHYCSGKTWSLTTSLGASTFSNPRLMYGQSLPFADGGGLAAPFGG